MVAPGRYTCICTGLPELDVVKNGQILEKQKILTRRVDASLGPGRVVIINLVQSLYGFVRDSSVGSKCAQS